MDMDELKKEFGEEGMTIADYLTTDYCKYPERIVKPELPYELDALEPYISEESVKYHFKKHH